MKTVIYYFSGTGNSLAIARELIVAFGGGEVVSISNAMKSSGMIIGADRVGVVYPVYALGAPGIVRKFIKKLKMPEGSDLFLVSNYAKVQGAGLTIAMRDAARAGVKVTGAFGVKMPNNYTPFGEAGDQDALKRIFDKAGKRIAEIGDILKRSGKVRAETGCFLARWLLWEPVAFLSGGMMAKEDKHFKVTGKCDGCGTCAKICPVNDIVMVGEKPQWQNRCEGCFACFHWCPLEAIEYGRGTVGKKRYHHPDINLGDMFPSMT